MNHWLVKQEPQTYPWEQFVAEGVTTWEGVRNHQARNNLRSMKRGDRVLFYASGAPKSVIGVARVRRGAFPDPTSNGDGEWVAVELEAMSTLVEPVTLAVIKACPVLQNLALVRQSRLSVSPVSSAEFAALVKLGGGEQAVRRARA